MKHAKDTQWTMSPTRERLAATRKRTLRSVPARGARSVWSECRSRVIEPRKSAYRLGLPVCLWGDNIAEHTIRRHRNGAQATCEVTGPGSKSRAKTYGGILESWESRTVLTRNNRNRTTPGQQRPGAGALPPKAAASETKGAKWESASEGNRSERTGGYGSLRGLVVAIESRVTEPKGSL